MREIKFRAWDIENKEMFYDAQDAYDNQGDVPASSFGSLLVDEDYILMQYTGLKDKNGKEIYEGDIVTYASDLPEQIIFKDAAFRWGGESDYVVKTREPNVLQVIGNIYEHSHFLQ